MVSSRLGRGSHQRFIYQRQQRDVEVKMVVYCHNVTSSMVNVSSLDIEVFFWS